MIQPSDVSSLKQEIPDSKIQRFLTPGNFVTVVSTTVAIALAIWFFVLERDNTSLAIVLRSTTALVSPGAKDSENITILYKNTQVDELRLTSFRLVNDGNVPIRKTDFDKPFQLHNGGGEILDVRRGDTDPSGLDFNIIRIEPNTIQVDPLLLNPGNYISFSIYTTTSIEQFAPSVRVAGFDQLDLVSDLETQANGPFGGLNVPLALALIAALVGVMGVAFSMVRLTRLDVYMKTLWSEIIWLREVVNQFGHEDQ